MIQQLGGRSYGDWRCVFMDKPSWASNRKRLNEIALSECHLPVVWNRHIAVPLVEVDGASVVFNSMSNSVVRVLALDSDIFDLVLSQTFKIQFESVTIAP
jgi:hypothetical protein